MVGAEENSLKLLFHLEIFHWIGANGIIRLSWSCPTRQKIFGADRHRNIRSAGSAFSWEKRQSRKDLRRGSYSCTWSASLRILFGLKTEEQLQAGSRALQEAALPEAFPKQRKAGWTGAGPSRCRNTNTMCSLCVFGKEFPNTQRLSLKMVF